MTSPDPDVDSFIDALRSDLPSQADERRIHARLVAAGVGVGAGLALPGMAAAASAGANAGLLPKLALLSWGAKMGLAGAVIAAVAVPVASELAKPEPAAAPTALVAATESPAGTKRSGSPHLAIPSDTENDVLRQPEQGASPELSSPEVGARSKLVERARQKPEVSRPEALPRGDAPSAASPSVASFPSVEAPQAASSDLQTSTLRQEAEVIERALSALRAGDRATALHWLVVHARRFPQGQLRRERERALERANDMNGGSGSPAPTR
jgi:hypothetical protein